MSESAKHLSANRSITVLAFDSLKWNALRDWSRGLDWVVWMLEPIRHGVDHGPTHPFLPTDSTVLEEHWQEFATGVWSQVIGPALVAAWQAAQQSHTQELMQIAHRLERDLPVIARRHSRHSGRLMLQSTRSARHQAILGKHRAAVADGRCPSHAVTVWAAISSLFQLGLANTCAEYLRMEWQILCRDLPTTMEPSGSLSFASLTTQILQRHIPTVANLRSSETSSVSLMKEA